MRLRVLSYNIHKGFNVANQRFVLKNIRESIQLVGADLVFLQEVLGHHESKKSKIEEWPTQAQFEFLADKTWPHHVYGKTAVYSSGHHGNAILSKHPIVSSENIDISTNRLESRGLLHAVIELQRPKTEVHAICLHLGLFEGERRRQLQSLSKRIAASVPKEAPLVVGGDFNDWWQSATAPLGRSLKLKEAYHEIHREHARTFPSWMPALRLDRIYVRNLTPRAARALTGPPWDQLSDHVALYAELEVGAA